LLRDAQLLQQSDASALWKVTINQRVGYLLQDRQGKRPSLVGILPGAGDATGLIDLMPIGIVQIRKDFSAVAANKRASFLLGAHSDAVYTGEWIEFLPDAARGELREYVDSDRLADLPLQLTVELNDHRKATRYLDISISKDVRSSLDGDRFIITLLDRGAEHRVKQQLRAAAEQDSLTKLLNRRAFTDTLSALSELEIAQLAIIYIDLDKFKDVNDIWGHAAGDELLKIAGLRLRGCARSSDLVARLGGDEFAIAAFGCTDDDALRALGENIARRMNGMITVAGHQIEMSASIGMAHGRWCKQVESTDAAFLEKLMSFADEAMYVAKRSPALSFNIFQEELLGKRERRNHQREEYWKLQADGAITPVFQPIIGPHGPVGLEALARTNYPLLQHNGGIEELIKTAKHEPRSNVFLDMLCRMAIDSYGQWIAENPDLASLRINVNVDIVQLREPGFAKQFLDWVRQADVDARNVCVEITETSLDDSIDELAAPLKALQNAGMRLSIDDFGTGYASLHRLLEFNFDQIKIDHVYTINALKDDRFRSILRSIVALGKAASMEVLAEGVETEEQARLCRDCGIDLFQGFLFQEPRELRELSDSLRAGSIMHGTRYATTQGGDVTDVAPSSLRN
jgi:diguanylate cyclase (GGDEF)-like protein